MRFAWQGFELEHPEDWAPVKLSGTYSEGYAQISGTGSAVLQVRWLKAGTPTRTAVESYLGRLERDARRARHRFDYHIEDGENQIPYTYRSTRSGRGCLLAGRSECDRRVFLLELSSDGSPRKAVFDEVLASFSPQGDGCFEWSLFGLNVRIPRGLSLQGKELKAGKTVLEFSDRGSLIRCERWGFAEQILGRHDLLDWVRSVGRLPSGDVVSNCPRQVELFRRGGLKPAVWLLARVQPDRNQITLIRSESRVQSMRPQWGWFV